jgi:hypothetical protein
VRMKACSDFTMFAIVTCCAAIYIRPFALYYEQALSVVPNADSDTSIYQFHQQIARPHRLTALTQVLQFKLDGMPTMGQQTYCCTFVADFDIHIMHMLQPRVRVKA